MSEDFVSFDLAKKLTLKGFNAPCIAYYDEGFLRYNTKYPFALTAEELLISHDSICTWVDAPTISQVLKWLREEKGISLNVYPSYFANMLYWTCDVISFIGEISIEERLGGDVKTYEEAAIYGLEYVLDNLI
jgi:hypothetical protein